MYSFKTMNLEQTNLLCKTPKESLECMIENNQDISFTENKLK
jgi:hypothetical protein